eukprot:CAMPEP_0197536670 /NCGR_PEP_ID=MMETSP1318-20131121/54522_1 /TAXON_ID=552666 /ORGANISM="Partenskyella glossopodia, Strain RCC365" /LENGTH=47 /DNA_ID= /DNA_START= /DNA_END= /DNA_ORIENTATION=
MTEFEGKNETTLLTEGIHLFDYTATDEGGNEASCKFQIEVQDRNEIT